MAEQDDAPAKASKPDDESKSDPIMKDPDKSRRMCAYWKSQIEGVEKETEKWFKKGSDVLKRYRDERDRISEEGQRRLNILWANKQVLKPALYSKPPQPIVERRFLDHDPKGRTSALILERSLRNEIEENDYHDSISKAVDDRLLPGRGQVWVRYEPEIGESVSIPSGGRQDMRDDQGEITDLPDDDETEKLESTGEEVVSESVPVDHVNWRDYMEFPARARTWREVQAVARRVFMSKQQCIDRFGEEIGSKIEADSSVMTQQDKSGTTDTAIFQDIYERQRIVWEIWNKEDRKVYWISTGYDHLCDAREDPLKLKHFFPCPEPLSATMTSETRIPVPDYVEYQDQAIQLDELTDRISKLSSACKVVGVYDASMRGNRGGVDRIFDESTENQLIPVENFAAFAEKGGLAAAIVFLPLDTIIKALEVLIEVRSKIMEDLDRVTMISDIMRGTTDARETMGAQRLKSNYSSTRLDNEKGEVARFARDVLRLVAEVMCKHFGDKTLIEASGIFHEEGIAGYMEEAGLSMDDFGGGMLSQTAPPMPSGAPSPPPMAALPPPSPGQASPVPPGSNVVPFHPPGAPQAGAPGGAAGMPGMGTTPLQPQQPRPSIFGIVQKIKAAIELLRKDVPRGYRIDIETDSMVQGNIESERDDAVQFVEGMFKFMQAAEMVVAGQPQAIPLMGKMLQFVVRKFRSGRDLEAAVDEYVDKIEKQAQAGGMQPKQDPQQAIAMIKMQTEQQKAQAEIGKAKLDAQSAQANDQRDQQISQMEFQHKTQIMQQEMQIKQRELEIKVKEMEAKAHFQAQQHQQKLQEMAIQAAMPKPHPSTPKEAAE